MFEDAGAIQQAAASDKPGWYGCRFQCPARTKLDSDPGEDPSAAI